jgi:hypothetical protein
LGPKLADEKGIKYNMTEGIQKTIETCALPTTLNAHDGRSSGAV